MERSPKVLTTKCSVKYRKSAWNVHEFEVWSGDMVCRVAALRMEKSILLWVGGREPLLSEIALGVPRAARGGLATALLGGERGEGGAAALARRLAAALARPAHVCCGQPFDRLAAALVERGIAAEIKNHPECF